jgi:hypothetical protein
MIEIQPVIFKTEVGKERPGKIKIQSGQRQYSAMKNVVQHQLFASL